MSLNKSSDKSIIIIYSVLDLLFLLFHHFLVSFSYSRYEFAPHAFCLLNQYQVKHAKGPGRQLRRESWPNFQVDGHLRHRKKLILFQEDAISPLTRLGPPPQDINTIYQAKGSTKIIIRNKVDCQNSQLWSDGVDQMDTKKDTGHYCNKMRFSRRQESLVTTNYTSIFHHKTHHFRESSLRDRNSIPLHHHIVIIRETEFYDRPRQC